MSAPHPAPFSRKLSVAPMMEWTDRHQRYFMRLLTRRTLLYTEMIVTGALIHGDRDRFLRHHEAEMPLAIQLGGSDPSALADCSRMAEDWGYGEVNLNVGCPSDRVSAGAFGASLMANPDLVARCVEAMSKATSLPVTVKHRIGIDDKDSYEELKTFVSTVENGGCQTFIVHARKAWLTGLSPKENREVPPLRYDMVHQIKQDFPQLEIILNGGVRSLDLAAEQLDHIDGVMIGRAAYETPYVMFDADQRIFGETTAPLTRRQVIEGMIPYIEAEMAEGVPLRAITRHMLGLYRGIKGAKAWRRHMSDSVDRKSVV